MSPESTQSILEVMDPADLEAVAFGTILDAGLEVGVEEQMVVLREAVHHAGADAQDLLLRVSNRRRAIVFGAGDLLEVVAVDAGPQLLGNQLIRRGEVRVNRLPA